MTNKKGVIVVDLDGTLYNSHNRNLLAQNGQWDEFHKASIDDNPNLDVLGLIDAFEGNCWIVACTGRDDRYRDITLEWFKKWSVPVDVLLMRPEGNWKSDTEIKPELLQGWLDENELGREKVRFILEDRDKMVDAWRALNFNCWQVREGTY